MASDMEKLSALLSRHTNKMKDTIDDTDLGELARTTRVLEHSNDLVDDVMTLVSDMLARRRDDQERERDRYEDDRRRDDRDYRGRDSRDSRDYRGRDGRGGQWDDRRR